MTVGIAAIVPTADSEIVTVSDARISFGDIIPATDEAVMKNASIAYKWGVMYAADDSTAFVPVLQQIQTLLEFEGMIDRRDVSATSVREATQASYEKEFSERFFREHLARFGYSDISEFRRDGLSQMGKDMYAEYTYKLASFDLGLELLIYGFGSDGRALLFTVTNPGRIADFDLLQYAAIGSGSLMALAALARKRMVPGLEETIYRLLDAKFSSETATGVGKKTHVITRSREGKVGMMRPQQIEEVRGIWSDQMQQADPAAALEILRKSNAVTGICSDEK